MIFEKFTAMDWVAIWGAITGSVAIGLDVWRIKKDRPRLKINRRQNKIEIDNIGKQPTTIKKINVYSYKNFMMHLLQKSEKKGKVPLSTVSQQSSTPVMIHPGESKSFSEGYGLRNFFDDKSKFYACEVEHSTSNKTVHKQIKL